MDDADLSAAVADEDLTYRQLQSLELALRFKVSEGLQQVQTLRLQHQQVQDRLKRWRRPALNST